MRVYQDSPGEDADRHDAAEAFCQRIAAHTVSGACCYCFTGFGDHHEATCPLYQGGQVMSGQPPGGPEEKPTVEAPPMNPNAPNPDPHPAPEPEPEEEDKVNEDGERQAMPMHLAPGSD
jgi:hypothetical protein